MLDARTYSSFFTVLSLGAGLSVKSPSLVCVSLSYWYCLSWWPVFNVLLSAVDGATGKQLALLLRGVVQCAIVANRICFILSLGLNTHRAPPASAHVFYSTALSYVLLLSSGKRRNPLG